MSTEQPAAAAPRTAHYGDTYPAEHEPPLVYGPDDERREQASTSDVRTPGFRCDDPDSRCDTDGHELAE